MGFWDDRCEGVCIALVGILGIVFWGKVILESFWASLLGPLVTGGSLGVPWISWVPRGPLGSLVGSLGVNLDSAHFQAVYSKYWLYVLRVILSTSTRSTPSTTSAPSTSIANIRLRTSYAGVGIGMWGGWGEEKNEIKAYKR